MLAPFALTAAFLALVVAVVTSGVFGSGTFESITRSITRNTETTTSSVTTSTATEDTQSTTSTGGTTETVETATDTVETTTTAADREAVYTIEQGDLLSTISEETGVSVEKLLELNPDVDPQTLVAGQKLKLK